MVGVTFRGKLARRPGALPSDPDCDEDGAWRVAATDLFLTSGDVCRRADLRLIARRISVIDGWDRATLDD